MHDFRSDKPYELVRGHLTPEAGQDSILPGQELLNSSLQTRNSSEEKWWRGVINSYGSDYVHVSFNSTLKGWHYVWRSHRYSSHTRHCFRVYTCSSTDVSSVFVHDIFSSPSFALHLRSKNSARSNPEAPSVAKTTTKRKINEADIACNTSISYKPNEPTLLEHIENRTLDRIHDLLQAVWSSPAKFRSGPDVIGLDDKLFETLQRIFESFVTILGSHRILNPMALRWINQRDRFIQICMEELKLNEMEYRPGVIDATYLEGQSAPSIFNEIRQVYRDNLRVVLAMENVSINAMYFPMKVASTAGIIDLDPCHPPSITIATLVFSRLNGESAHFDPSIYSSGLSGFASESHFAVYARDLLQFRRVCHQSMMVTLMGKCLSNPSGTEQHPFTVLIDFSGNWINASLGDESELKQIKIPGVLGALLGEFHARMALRSFNKLYIAVTKDRLLLVALEGARLEFILDSQEVRSSGYFFSRF